MPTFSKFYSFLRWCHGGHFAEIVGCKYLLNDVYKCNLTLNFVYDCNSAFSIVSINIFSRLKIQNDHQTQKLLIRANKILVHIYFELFRKKMTIISVIDMIFLVKKKRWSLKLQEKHTSKMTWYTAITSCFLLNTHLTYCGVNTNLARYFYL